MRILLLLYLPAFCMATVADYGTIPKGVNPTLYNPDDRVVQLDETTFNDTVYCNHPECVAHVVEFYSDWCGHCRAFAPLYKSLAKDIGAWKDVIRVAAMNCADAVNQATCRANGVAYFPYIKYFPRNSTDTLNSSLLRPFRSMAEMRDQLTKVLMDDYSVNRLQTWPNFDFLKDMKTYSELWEDAANDTEFIVIVFENHPSSLTGAQLLLDLLPHRERLVGRRALKNHPLVEALHLTDFPSLVIFKKGDKTPVVQAELRRLLFNEVEQFLGNVDNKLPSTDLQFRSKKNQTEDCKEQPAKYALLRETARTGAPLHGRNLTALYGFVMALHDHLPTTTTHFSDEHVLDRSSSAIRVFKQLAEFLEKKSNNFSEIARVDADDWQKTFLALEESEGNPFPITAEWEHCRGTTRHLRGYSCGLWTILHALTVSAYKQQRNSMLSVATYDAVSLLDVIREWVANFFGCLHCREHFVRMTTRTFPIEQQVQKAEDGYLYLWKAHNIVNNRLRGRDTEDPNFLKYEFPAPFLCETCSNGTSSTLSEASSAPFLLQYYSDIRPYTAPTEKANGNKR